MTYQITKHKNNKKRINKTIRFTEEEYNQIMQKALVYCGGNFSEWIRYAAKHCIPFKQDMEKQDVEHNT